MSATPRHVAIIMDGNGRWAAARGLPRHAGHKAGISPVRMVIEECSRRGVEALTLFAFSSENWGRPSAEVSGIMNLFLDALDRETAQLHANCVRVRIIGDRRTLPVRLQARVAAAHDLTAANSGLRLQLAVSYGGRWDIVQANQRLAEQCLVGALNPRDITEAHVTSALELADVFEEHQVEVETVIADVIAPAANVESAIFCCGIWRTRSFISVTVCGQILQSRISNRHWRSLENASAVSD